MLFAIRTKNIKEEGKYLRRIKQKRDTGSTDRPLTYRIPEELSTWLIVAVTKKTGDTQDPWKCRGISRQIMLRNTEEHF